MSETCGAGACNPPERIKIGTVGPPAPGVEIKLAEDGEVLIALDGRDDRLPQPARARPPRRSTPTAGCTPATSASSTRTATCRIVDRKKELIITAAGKNMSPANIESTLKGASR